MSLARTYTITELKDSKLGGNLCLKQLLFLSNYMYISKGTIVNVKFATPQINVLFNTKPSSNYFKKLRRIHNWGYHNTASLTTMTWKMDASNFIGVVQLYMFQPSESESNSEPEVKDLPKNLFPLILEQNDNFLSHTFTKYAC